ncbi:uncharacterized protein LOC131668293 [Phymastichus coffea]|uniref:uncharacterized protein LOC131668293 n=1 Tax=Phymastichus coffea TaxID=108790 RepID=UPI00273AE5C1|nr:uncharacterized protein LOC131668293 [Phymastichus coffea]
MAERFHRTLKAALMCHARTPWPESLPLVLLGLRNCFKEDLQASPAEMVYGTSLRLPGEFFVASSLPADPASFVSKLQGLMGAIRPIPAADHSARRPFYLKDLATCTHVFRRVETVRKPLEQPYSGPHEVVRRVSEKVYVIRVDGHDKTVTTDALKPAYLASSDRDVLRPPGAGRGRAFAFGDSIAIIRSSRASTAR